MPVPNLASAAARAVATAAALAFCLAACASVDRREDFRAFAAGDYAEARALAEARLVEPGPDTTLDLNLAGSAALAQGDVRAAHRHFVEAFTDLEDLSSTAGETAGAMVGADASKRWKGDPHERCMNAYYAGVTYWLLGDPDNAAACFKAGLLRDADSAQGSAQSDFGALWFLLAAAQREAWHEDRGAQAFARARELLPDNPWTDPRRAADANVLVVVDVGLGPRKAPSGPHGSQLAWVRQRYRTAGAEVAAGGASLGHTAPAADVFFQAVTRGRKTMDDVNTTKAVVKDAAVIGGVVMAENAGSSRNRAIGLGLILAGLLLPAEADVRGWDTLPGEIHVLFAKLPAGPQVLAVQPEDADGRPIAGTLREIPITVRDGHLTFVWLRAGPAPAGGGNLRTDGGSRP